MYDGTPTYIERHPYLVSIYVNGNFECAGAIVSERWVITTGDCTNGFPAAEVWVISGSNDSAHGDYYLGWKNIIHPNYQFAMNNYDFAVVQIMGKFQWSPSTQPIKIPRAEPRVKTKMTVVGWGWDDGVEGANATMRQGYMFWLAKKVCAKWYKGFPFPWTPTMACAYNKGKTTLCSNDLGDPFTYKGVLYGMMLDGYAYNWCTGNSNPLVLSDISAVAAWVKNITGAKYMDEL